MEPVTAVGFMAAVIQLLEFGIKTARAVNEVQERGSTDDVDNANYVSSQLSSLSKSVRDQLELSSMHGTLSGEEKELLDIGRKCCAQSQKLQEELDKLMSRDGGNGMVRIKVVAKTIWKKNKIAAMQEKLDGCRKILESRLLHRLR